MQDAWRYDVVVLAIAQVHGAPVAFSIGMPPNPFPFIFTCILIAAQFGWSTNLSAVEPSNQVRGNGSPQVNQDPAFSTRVLKWKDGKKACFLLAFDDGAPTQLKNVVPELDKRKIAGTFYLVTGNSLYAGLRSKWELAVKSPYIVAANHTYTHKGVNNAEELNSELEKCNEVLHALHPGISTPRLLAFGKPGGVPWNVTKEELQTALEKHHLVDRPPFAGPPIHYKSPEEMLAVVDKALAKGEMGHLDFHGVGGDWLATPLEWFTALLDKLENGRDQLWITDAASWAKYVHERNGAEIKILESGNDHVRILLTSKADGRLYDEPLTLLTRVPEEWKTCVVLEGTKRIELPVRDGSIQYNAIPGGGEIRIDRLPAE